jgi:O-acetyl-ADP-ribose deacetylase (regulator of RNase III)
MDKEHFRVLLYVPESAHEQVTYLFREVPAVTVSVGDALQTDADALIVPLNSFGYFDGGFALRVADHLGFSLQEELRRRIGEDHFGELVVGQAEILPTQKDKPAFVIAAPLSRAAPGDLRDSVNVYLAMRGALLAVAKAPDCPIQSVGLPLMGVDEGKLTPYAAARQIRYGVRAILRERPRRMQNLSKATRREANLKRQERPPQ